LRNQSQIFFLFTILSVSSPAQTDWVKWEGKQTSYEIQKNIFSFPKVHNESFGLKIISFFRDTYSTLISDLDGDNCPFFPSCSHFFIESLNEVGIFKGSLMFSDRFIRDLNFFKAKNLYPKHISGKYSDPVINYTLNSEKIKHYPGGILVY
jgi:putative component of membrane protein insertase Oxa1/YidC/SpoIIIJ protein YidD